MGTEAQKTEEEIYHAALAKPATKRSAFLLEACAGDTALLERMQVLLASRKQAGDFLITPPLDLDIALDDTGVAEGPDTIIGRYKLLEKIGEGGMARVYMAEQERPIRRKVALKIIKVGMDTEQVIARFEAERQALALMDHPHIAKVLDAGATDKGRPYFVMELVRGQSITQYCNQRRMRMHERLALFMQVCSAVQHAHQKGIIHRDIKPSNVMVTQRDGVPLPKIIDFGIAKATNQRLTERTLFTRYEQIVGTPAYMSPEQAELSESDVDTRSDIYSLGILLYELLTGTTPFSEEELHKAGYLEMQRIIREEAPTKPSTKLSTLGNTESSVAAERGATLDILQRQLRGDLDWIVLKALEKNRDRRYDAASALALDVQRYLAQEPVSARAPRFSYILGKYLCKHRFKLAISAAIVVLLAAVVSMSLMWHDKRMRLSEAAEITEQAILSQARAALSKRDLETALANTKSILNSVHVGAEARLLYAGILVEGMQSKAAVSRLEDLLTESPEISGAAHALLARIYWEGDFPESEKLAKVEEHKQKAETLLPETAEAHYLRALTALSIKDKLKSLDKAQDLDPTHFESLRMRAYIYQASRKYERLEHDAIVMIALRPGDVLGYSLRAMAQHKLGHNKEALKSYKRALRIAPNNSTDYDKLSAKYCEVLMNMDEFENVILEANAALHKASDKAELYFHMYCALTRLGRYEEAKTLFHEVSRTDPSFPGRVRDWSIRYVFDTLAAGRLWYPSDRKPQGDTFSALLEADDIYQGLSLKASRLIVDAFHARSSPDGKTYVFCTGFHGNSGVALYHVETGEIDLLITPGKDPSWSPDGRYIAFVRDCQVLSVSELANTSPANRLRLPENEEIWLMNADGTEPRRLALGGWPYWSHDSKRIYYHSWREKILYTISIEDGKTTPQLILKDNDRLSTQSPDGKTIAYMRGNSLMTADLTLQSVHEAWNSPFYMHVGVWCTQGRGICLGVHSPEAYASGFWIYDLDTNSAQKVLQGPVSPVATTPDRRRLFMDLRAPFFEIWVADLDPSVSVLENLGPGRTVDEHYQGTVDYFSNRIQIDSQNPNNYYLRARHNSYLDNNPAVNADLERYEELAHHEKEIVGIRFGIPENLGPAVNTSGRDDRPLPHVDGLKIVLSRYNPEGTSEYWITTRVSKHDAWSVPERLPSFENKLWIPGMTTIDGLEQYEHQWPGDLGNGDIYVRKRASREDVWDETKNLGLTVNSAVSEISPAISPDGLELYFSDSQPKRRPGGQGGADLWVSKRTHRNAAWIKPVNLGASINSPYHDCRPSLSADGRLLVFDSKRPGGQGRLDIWLMRRSSLDAPWEKPVNLGEGINTPSNERYPHFSADGSCLYYTSSRFGGHGSDDIWQVPVEVLDCSPDTVN